VFIIKNLAKNIVNFYLGKMLLFYVWILHIIRISTKIILVRAIGLLLLYYVYKLQF